MPWPLLEHYTASNGTVSSGVEDELTSAAGYGTTITGGSYDPISSSDQNNLNNAGTLNATRRERPKQIPGRSRRNGDLEMIESDSMGAPAPASPKNPPGTAQFNSGAQTFAFGFTGVDSGGKRVGYAGMLPMSDGIITGGMFDFNDNGASTGACTSPCSLTAARPICRTRLLPIFGT